MFGEYFVEHVCINGQLTAFIAQTSIAPVVTTTVIGANGVATPNHPFAGVSLTPSTWIHLTRGDTG